MIVLLSLLSGTAQAADFVFPSPGGETFQEVVDAASSGDRIIITPGEPTYYDPVFNARAGWQPVETITIDKDLTIMAVSPPSEIAENDTENNVYVEPDFVTIVTTLFTDYEGVFLVTDGAELTLRNLVFKGIEWICDDGIDNDGNGLQDGDDPACEITFLDTAGSSEKPPLPPNTRVATVQAESSLIMESCWVQGFTGAWEGSVIRAQEAEVTINTSLVAYNDGQPVLTLNNEIEDGEGGALHVVDSEVTITDSTFLHNRSNRGGAIWARGADQTLTVTNNIFSMNQGEDGGAIYGEQVDLVAVNNKFIMNTANLMPSAGTDSWRTHEGGAIFLEDSKLQINNNVFHLNASLDYGGAVYVARNLTGRHVDLYHNTFINNSAVAVAGGGSLMVNGTDFTFWNNIVSGSGGGAISAINWGPLTGPDITEYNDFFASAPVFGGELMTYPVPTSNLNASPDLSFVTDNAPEANWHIQRYWANPTSPTIDAGDPGTPTDPGGTLPDLGAYGGADAMTTDNDGDGWESIHDCDDTDPNIYPLADEPCDDLDNDCNGLIDDNEGRWYEDKDYDGYGDPGIPPIEICPGDAFPPILGGGIYVENNDDCDDSDPRVSPGTPEYCDGIDNDCDTRIDEDIPVQAQYPDIDGDGFGDMTATLDVVNLSCPPDGFSPFGTDCDDRDPQVYPLVKLENIVHLPLADHPLEDSEADRDLTYVADGIDQDCDNVDLCYADLDGDGFGAEVLPNEPAQYVVDNDLNCANLSSLTATNATDCDDRDPLAFPGGEEITADGLDQDCNGRDQCWEDADGDGYGSDQVILDNDLDCDNDDANTSSRGGDCDDRPGDGAEANPEKEEVCDGLDNNCDGQIDEISSPDAETYFLDSDGDGFGDVTQTVRACALPVGYAEIGGDCDDNEPRAYPGNQEVCDEIDNNCESGVDEDSAINVITWYEDLDGDGYGSQDFYQNSCSEPEEGGPWVRAGKPLDCDDGEATVGPCAGGCATVAPVSGRMPAQALALLAGVMLVRRRRSDRI